MSEIIINGVKLHYCDSGQSDRETLLFVHGLMLASESFEAQVAAFRHDYRVVTFDLRGQGRSAKPQDGLDLETLAEDTGALIEALQCSPAHIVGFSMGAFIAMRVAARRPDLVRTLTLIGPSADAEEPDHLARYNKLLAVAVFIGPQLMVGVMLKILFGPTWLSARENSLAIKRWKRALSRLPRSIFRAARASANRRSIVDELALIAAPTLIVSGEEDRPISPAKSRAVHNGIKGSQFLSAPRAGHAVMIEQPEMFNDCLRAFIETA